MNTLSPLQISILQNLVMFKQLTIPQFTKLNQGHSEQSIRRSLDKLFHRRKPLLKRIEFKKISHFGRLSYVYSLSLLGKKALESNLGYAIKEKTFTPAVPRLTHDYFHRVSTIDFHIYMHLLESKESFQTKHCNNYFLVEKVANSFISINKIFIDQSRNIIPDMIALLSQGGKERWIMYELHNGNDKRRIKEQIRQHAICLTGLFAHRKYRIEAKRFYYILVVFEEEAVMKAVIKDLSSDIWYREVAQFFLCRPKDSLINTFLRGWTNLSGREASIVF